MGTIWVNTHKSQSLTAVTQVAIDQLSSQISPEILNRSTIVAVKGKLQFQPIHTAAAVVKPEVFAGLVVGVTTLDVVDFPDPYILFGETQGWMAKEYFLGAGFGDATLPVYWEQQNVFWDVKAKRKLKGIGRQTLWLFMDVKALGNLSTLNVDLSILLYTP